MDVVALALEKELLSSRRVVHPTSGQHGERVATLLHRHQQSAVLLHVSHPSCRYLNGQEVDRVMENQVVVERRSFVQHGRDHAEHGRERRGREAAFVQLGGILVTILVLEEEVEVVEDARLQRDREERSGVRGPGFRVDDDLHGALAEAALEKEEENEAENAFFRAGVVRVILVGIREEQTDEQWDKVASVQSEGAKTRELLHLQNKEGVWRTVMCDGSSVPRSAVVKVKKRSSASRESSS